MLYRLRYGTLDIVSRAILLYGLNNPQPVYQQENLAVIAYQL